MWCSVFLRVVAIGIARRPPWLPRSLRRQLLALWMGSPGEGTKQDRAGSSVLWVVPVQTKPRPMIQSCDSHNRRRSCVQLWPYLKAACTGCEKKVFCALACITAPRVSAASNHSCVGIQQRLRTLWLNAPSGSGWAHERKTLRAGRREGSRG